MAFGIEKCAMLSMKSRGKIRGKYRNNKLRMYWDACREGKQEILGNIESKHHQTS